MEKSGRTIEVIFHNYSDRRRKSCVTFIDNFTDEEIDRIVNAMRSIGCKVTVNQSGRSPKVSINGTKRGSIKFCDLAVPLHDII